MQTLTVREVCLSFASGRRRHHSGGLTDLYSPQVSSLSTGDTYTASPPASSIGNKNFSVMTIGGGNEGAVIYTAADLAANTPIQSVTVGSVPVNVVSIYLEPGNPGPNGDPAVCIDAFNINTGTFIDDDFVSIVVNGTVNAALSTSANYDGVVDSMAAGVVVRAFDNFVTVYTPAGVQDKFTKWQSLAGTETVTVLDLAVGQKTNAYYLALYQTPAPLHINRPSDNYAIWQWVDYATMVDGNPHFPMGPEIAGFQAGIAFAMNANFFSKELRKQVADIAARQVVASAAAIAKKITESVNEKGA